MHYSSGWWDLPGQLFGQVGYNGVCVAQQADLHVSKNHTPRLGSHVWADVVDRGKVDKDLRDRVRYMCWHVSASFSMLAHSLKTSLTGATLRLVPIMTNRSTFSRSLYRQSSNSESRACPKKVMSGWHQLQLFFTPTTRRG